MTTSAKPIRVWTLVAATMALGSMLSAILATVILDRLLKGPGPSSVTTRVPGFVYASATVMKVCVAAGLVWSVIVVVRRVLAGLAKSAVSQTAGGSFPYWGFASIAFAPLTPLAGAIAVVTIQAFARTPESLSTTDMSQFSSTAVTLMLLLIVAGALAAVTSFVKRERPSMLPTLGVLTNVLLIVLFWHFEFYAVGFDQDTWAAR